MKIYKWCPLTKAVVFMDIDITEEQLAEYEDGYRLEVVAPHLSKVEIDFIRNTDTKPFKARRRPLFRSRYGRASL